MLFSVIIPTYNRSERLKIALESLVNQTYKDFEVIIGDDGSTDSTKDVVDSFKNRLSIKYIWDENWGGPARPRNEGIKQAAGEWICFLDSDDFWYPEKLNSCLSYLENNDFLYHDFDVVSNNNNGIKEKKICRRISNEDAYMDLLLKWNGINNSGVVIRRSILEKAGSFSEDRRLIGVEDFDMWLRVAKITNRFFYIQEVLGSYFLSDTSISKNIEESLNRESYLLDKYRNDISYRQYLRVKGILELSCGLRYLTSNERNSANRYFYHILYRKNSFILKLKALVCLVLGKKSFTLRKWYFLCNHSLDKS